MKKALDKEGINSATPSSVSDPLATIISHLPILPSVLRYYDDFDQKVRTIHALDAAYVFELHINGSKRKIDLINLQVNFRKLLRHLVVFLLAKKKAPATIYNYVYTLQDADYKDISNLLSAGPIRVKSLWKILRAKYTAKHQYFFEGLKWLLRMFCEYQLCCWSLSYEQYISEVLPSPSRDKFRTVRTGDAFLSVADEAKIVRFLDKITASIVSNAAKISSKFLESTGMLLCSYQFAMRPVQIAMLTLSDVRIWNDIEELPPTVHLTFKMVKQRSRRATKPLTRRVKREWSPIFVEIVRRRSLVEKPAGVNRLFSIASSQDVSANIIELASRIVGSYVTATDLRHTAAERLVDAGVSQEELAEFLGHADISTCQVYFRSTANQAERVNKALGISNIYQKVAKIAHARFISSDELANLKDEQQIAGVPHGISIAGIGGCSTGQPSCTFNPITSCYGCHKFMPISDLEIHKRVLADMRGLVKLFFDISKVEENLPAYLQLKRTITCIQSIIEELEESKSDSFL